MEQIQDIIRNVSFAPNRRDKSITNPDMWTCKVVHNEDGNNSNSNAASISIHGTEPDQVITITFDILPISGGNYNEFHNDLEIKIMYGGASMVSVQFTADCLQFTETNTG